MQGQALTSATRPEPSASLRDALRSGLSTPLAALRASMESLTETYDARDPRGSIVLAALDEVLRLSRSVEELVEYADPPRPMPLACRVAEILVGARQRLAPPDRARAWVARDADDPSLLVDGPLLGGALARLAEGVLRAGSDAVLLRARREPGALVFCVVGRGVVAGAARGLELGRLVAERDVRLLGGSLEVRATPLGLCSSCVRLPALVAEEAA